MQSLNLDAKKVFSKIIEAMKGKQHLQIESWLYYPLTVELLDKNIATAVGNGDAYSFCNYYKKNGDLMQAPEMCFILIDNRSADSEDWEKVVVLPYMFQYADTCSYELSIIIENQKLMRVNLSLQKRHVSLGNQFMYQIECLDYLKFIGDGN